MGLWRVYIKKRVLGRCWRKMNAGRVDIRIGLRMGLALYRQWKSIPILSIDEDRGRPKNGFGLEDGRPL